MHWPPNTCVIPCSRHACTQEALLPATDGRDAPTESVIDSFFYVDHQLNEITCPAHDDPGLITLVTCKTMEACVGQRDCLAHMVMWLHAHMIAWSYVYMIILSRGRMLV